MAKAHELASVNYILDMPCENGLILSQKPLDYKKNRTAKYRAVSCAI
ncbi:MAG: hypothetical protein K0R55_1326 [Sporomusa sp.]|nr:hypothetical protein [Sporomusa sp.]